MQKYTLSLVGFLCLALFISCEGTAFRPETREYEQISGTVTAIHTTVTSNAWNGMKGACRVTVATSTGQKTFSPYWRTCYEISEGDIVSVYRRVDPGLGSALDGDWKFRR